MPVDGNLFASLPENLPEELIENLVESDEFRLERIVSTGHVTPAGEWYDQNSDEWVVLLTGSARLLFEGPEEVVTLKPGDHLKIPAHRKHRVEWTDPDEPTVWLALHFHIPY
ncbi:MAG: cupin domain-containing protein [Planctomycetota bacterium]|nr:cupin domain-containing protein [Planctomycetota bacterium]MDA0918278.1 cupin domain-containing protein [Planctomycetota bacterium]MDA1158806.1 cupin domain-containing protein [Planctomycetota bacterium]